MNAANSERLLQHIRRLVGDPPGTPSDGELLRRYRQAGDQAAFAALVRRHGPMVLSVCQSVLRQSQDVEDAFQATFLILMQKAGCIRQQHGLGGWLQRVAYRVALQARANSLRRRSCEAQAARSPIAEPSCDDLSWRELRSILHAELAALPERFRAPLVLCYLEGLTQEEAVRRLGCTAATLKGRLQRGREKLRRRLERRGVALTTALAAALTGQALAANAVPSLTMTMAATALAHGFLRPILSIKLAMLSAVLLSLGVVAGGVALRSASEPRPSGSGATPNRSLTVAAQKEDAHGDPLPEGAIARLGTVRFNHGDGLNALFFSPDGKTIISQGNGSIRFWDAGSGKELDRIPIRTDRRPPSDLDQATLLADGKTFVTLVGKGSDGQFVQIWDLARKKELRKLTLLDRGGVALFPRNALSPDGKQAILDQTILDDGWQVFDLTTGMKLYQLGKGDKEYLAVAFLGNDRIVSADQQRRLEVWERRTGKLLRQLSHETPIGYLLASPDGRWLASLEHYSFPLPPDNEQTIVHLWDVDTGKVKHSVRAKPKHLFTKICFSPDGKMLLTASTSQEDWWRERVGADLWDLETGRRRLGIDGASGIATDVVAISPDGSRLAAGRRSPPACDFIEGKFELWDLKTGKRVSSENNRHTYDATVFLDRAGDGAVLIGRDTVSSWDIASGRQRHSFALPRDTLRDDRCLSSDGRYATTLRVVGGDFLLFIWDVAAGKCMYTLREYPVNVAFSPDSSLLATLHRKKQKTLVRLWDVRSGKLVRFITDEKEDWPGEMAFTTDGKLLFVVGKHVAAGILHHPLVTH